MEDYCSDTNYTTGFDESGEQICVNCLPNEYRQIFTIISDTITIYQCTDCLNDDNNYVTEDGICQQGCEKLINNKTQPKQCLNQCPLWYEVYLLQYYCTDECNYDSYIITDIELYQGKQCTNCSNINNGQKWFINESQPLYNQDNIYYLCQQTCINDLQFIIYKDQKQYCVDDCTDNTIYQYNSYQINGENKICKDCQFPYSLIQDDFNRQRCQLCDNQKFYANYTYFDQSTQQQIDMFMHCIDECKYSGSQVYQSEELTIEIQMCYGTEINGEKYINYPLCPKQIQHNTTENKYVCEDCSSTEFKTEYYTCQSSCWDDNMEGDSYRLFINVTEKQELTCVSNCSTICDFDQPQCSNKEQCEEKPYEAKLVNEKYTEELFQCDGYCSLKDQQYMDWDTHICSTTLCNYLNTTTELIDKINVTLYICEQHPSQRCQYAFESDIQDKFICSNDCQNHLYQEDFCVDKCDDGYYINNETNCTQDKCEYFYEISQQYDSIKCIDTCDKYQGYDQNYIPDVLICVDKCSDIENSPYTDNNICRDKCSQQPNIYTYGYTCVDQCPQEQFYVNYENKTTCEAECSIEYQIYISEQLIFCIHCKNVIIFDNQQYVCQQSIDQQLYTVNQQFQINITCEEYYNQQNNIIKYYQSYKFTDTLLNNSKFCVQECPLYANNQLNQCTYQCPYQQIIVDDNIYCQTCDNESDGIFQVVEMFNQSYNQCSNCSQYMYVHSNLQCNETNCSVEVQYIYHQQNKSTVFCVKDCINFVQNMQCTDICQVDSYIYNNNQRYCDENCNYYLTRDDQYNNVQQCVQQCTQLYPFIQPDTKQCLDNCGNQNLDNKYSVIDEINVCNTECLLPKIFQQQQIQQINAQICDNCSEMVYELSNNNFYCGTEELCVCYYDIYCYGINVDSRNIKKCQYITQINDNKYICGECTQTDYIYEFQCLDICPIDTFLSTNNQCVDQCNQDEYYQWQETQNMFVCQDSCPQPYYNGFDSTHSQEVRRCELSCMDFDIFRVAEGYTCLDKCYNNHHYWITNQTCTSQCGTSTISWILQINDSICVDECQNNYDHKQNFYNGEGRNYCFNCTQQLNILLFTQDYKLYCSDNCQSTQDIQKYLIDQLCIELSCQDYSQYQYRKYNDYIYFSHGQQNYCYQQCQIPLLFIQSQDNLLCMDECQNDTSITIDSKYYCADCNQLSNNIWYYQQLSDNKQHKQCTDCNIQNYYVQDDYECTDSCNKFIYNQATLTYTKCVYTCPNDVPFSINQICNQDCNQDSYINKTYYQNDNNQFVFCDTGCQQFIDTSPLINEVKPCVIECSDDKTYNLFYQQGQNKKECLNNCDLYYGIDINYSTQNNRCVQQCSIIDSSFVALDKQCLENCPNGYDVVNNTCTLNCINYFDYFSIYCLSTCQQQYILNLDKKYCADCSTNTSGNILTFQQNIENNNQYYCNNTCTQQKIIQNTQLFLCLEITCYSYSLEQNRIYDGLQYQSNDNICQQQCDLYVDDNQIDDNQLYCMEKCDPLEYQLINQLKYCKLCDNVTDKMYYYEIIDENQWKRCQLCEYDKNNKIYQQLDNQCSNQECFLYQSIIKQDIEIRQCITQCNYFITERQCSQQCNYNGFTLITVNDQQYKYCDYDCKEPQQYVSMTYYNNVRQCTDSCKKQKQFVQDGQCVYSCQIYIYQNDEMICDNCTDPQKGLYVNVSLSQSSKQCTECPENFKYINRVDRMCISQNKCTYQNQTYSICESNNDQQNCKYFYQINYQQRFRCVKQCDADDYIKLAQTINNTITTGYLCVEICDLFINKDQQCLDNCQADLYYNYISDTEKVCQEQCIDKITQIDETYHDQMLRCIDSCTEHSTLQYNYDDVCVDQCIQPKEFVDSQQNKICISECDSNVAMIETLICQNQCPLNTQQQIINNMTMCYNCQYGQILSYDSDDPVFQLKNVKCTDCNDQIYKQVVDYLVYEKLFCTKNTCGFTSYYIQNYKDYNIFNNTNLQYCQQNCTSNQYINLAVDDPKEYTCVTQCDDNKWQEHDNKFYCEQCEIFIYSEQGSKECSDCNLQNLYLYDKECNNIECYRKMRVLNISNNINICQSDCNDGIGLQQFLQCDQSCQYVYLDYILGKIRNICGQQCQQYYVQLQNTTICYNNCPQQYPFISSQSKECLQDCTKYYYINNDFSKKCVDNCQSPYIQQGQKCIICPIFYDNIQCKQQVQILNLSTMKEVDQCDNKQYNIGNNTYCIESCLEIQMLEYNNICQQYCPYPSINDNGKCVTNCSYFEYINDERTCKNQCTQKYIYVEEFQSNLCVQNCQNTEYIFEYNNQCSNQLCNNIYTIQNNHIICLENCDTQVTNNLCQNCNDNQFIVNNTCVNDCGNLYIFENQCQQDCTSQYIKIVLLDKYCIQNCQQNQFNIIVNNLIQCVDQCPYNKQYYLENSTCIQQCDQKIVGNQCLDNCPQNYYQQWNNQNQCSKCDQYKNYIINNQCITCYDGVIMYTNNIISCTDQCIDQYLYIDNNISELCTDIECSQDKSQLQSFQSYNQININNICTKTCQGYLQNNICVPKCEIYTLEQNECGTCNISTDYYTIKYTNFYCTECKGDQYYTIKNYCAENIQCKDYNLLLQINNQIKQCVEECDSQIFIEQNNQYVCIDQCDNQYIVEIKPFKSLQCQSQCNLKFVQQVESGPSQCLQDCPNYLSHINLQTQNYQCTDHNQCITYNYIVFDSSETYRCTNSCTKQIIQYHTINGQQYNLCLRTQDICDIGYYTKIQINNRDILVCQQQKCLYYQIINDLKMCQDECQEFKIYQQLTVNYMCVQECSEQLPYVMTDNLCQSDCDRLKFSLQIEDKNNSYLCQEQCNKTYIGDTILSGVYVCIDSCKLLGDLYLYSEQYTLQLDSGAKDYYHCVLFCSYHSFALRFICSDQCEDNQYVQYDGVQKICKDTCEQGQFYQTKKLLDLDYKLCVNDCENLVIEHSLVNECSDQENILFDWIEYANQQCQGEIN